MEYPGIHFIHRMLKLYGWHRVRRLSFVFVMWNGKGDALPLALALAGEREFGFKYGLS